MPDCPDFTRAKNKLLFWDKYFMPRYNIHLNVCKQVTVVVLLLLRRNSWNRLTEGKKNDLLLIELSVLDRNT